MNEEKKVEKKVSFIGGIAGREIHGWKLFDKGDSYGFHRDFDERVPWRLELSPSIVKGENNTYFYNLPKQENREKITVGDFVFKVLDKNKWQFRKWDGPSSLDVLVRTSKFHGKKYSFSTVGKWGYSEVSESQLEHIAAGNVLDLLLDLCEELRRAGKVVNRCGDIVNYDWYYIDHDSAATWRFFICDKDEIILPEFRIHLAGEMDGPDNDVLPANILSRWKNEPDDRFGRDSTFTETALARICYRKWETETLPGRISKEEKRMEEEKNPSVVESGKSPKLKKLEKWLSIWAIGILVIGCWGIIPLNILVTLLGVSIFIILSLIYYQMQNN
jgi:hypothetical protein